MVVSHRWEEPDHPDESRKQLKAIQQRLRTLEEEGMIKLKDALVWYDYCCLPQAKESDQSDCKFKFHCTSKLQLIQQCGELFWF